jgi:hypothetical protein
MIWIIGIDRKLAGRPAVLAGRPLIMSAGL